MNREQREALVELLDAQADVIISQLGDNYTSDEYDSFLKHYVDCQNLFIRTTSDSEIRQLELDL